MTSDHDCTRGVRTTFHDACRLSHTDRTASFPDLTKTLKIIAGDPTQSPSTFIVPEELLTAKSEFFKAACRKERKEAQTRKVKLPDIEGYMFNRYLIWIYGQGVPVKLSHGQLPETMDDLVQLWILADRLMDFELHVQVLDQMLDLLKANTTELMEHVTPELIEHVTPELINKIWSSTTASRGIRLLIIDAYVSWVWASELRPRMAELDACFLQELMLTHVQITEGSSTLENHEIKKLSPSACKYHEHDDHHPKQDKCLPATSVVDENLVESSKGF